MLALLTNATNELGGICECGDDYTYQQVQCWKIRRQHTGPYKALYIHVCSTTTNRVPDDMGRSKAVLVFNSPSQHQRDQQKKVTGFRRISLEGDRRKEKDTCAFESMVSISVALLVAPWAQAWVGVAHSPCSVVYDRMQNGKPEEVTITGAATNKEGAAKISTT